MTDVVFIQDVADKRFALLRDGDIPTLLRESDRPQIGFIGSDSFGELTDRAQASLNFRPLADMAVRFALASPKGNCKNVQKKLELGDTINVATSYPRATKSFVGQIGVPFKIVTSPRGSIEALPFVRNDVDAVIDLVKSGDTLRANGLNIVADNLGKVAIGAVWKSKTSGNENTMKGSYEDYQLMLAALRIIDARVQESKRGCRDSYTQRLAGEPNKLVKKLGEESAELLAAFLTGIGPDCAEETADNLYTMQLLLSMRGSSLLEAIRIFAARNTA